MIYLLDANTLIDAKRDYYPIDRVPEFWDWLIFQGELGSIKIPIEIYEEFSDSKDIKGNKDTLASWAENPEVKGALLFAEEADPSLVSQVTYQGYAPDPTDDELETIGRDPFLISYALKDPGDRCIVTTEGSKPKRKRSNRHVPDVCNDFGIKSVNNFQLIRILNFSTNWQASAHVPQN